MKVKIIATGKIEEYSDFYAVRLIEQGKAIKVDCAPVKKEKPEKERPKKEKK